MLGGKSTALLGVSPCRGFLDGSDALRAETAASCDRYAVRDRNTRAAEIAMDSSRLWHALPQQGLNVSVKAPAGGRAIALGTLRIRYRVDTGRNAHLTDTDTRPGQEVSSLVP